MEWSKIAETVAKELSLGTAQVTRTSELLAANTIPFIARYRKEVTGGLDEVQLAAIEDRVTYLRNLEERREDVLRLIGEQGKLTPELEADFAKAKTLQEVDDLYLPYRQKRKTRASVARERGLGPLAELIVKQAVAADDLTTIVAPFVSAELGVESVEAALAGARDIVAETVAEDASVRKALREVYQAEGVLSCALREAAKDTGRKYTLYYEFSSPVAKMAPHRTLAINRAEAEGVLKVEVTLGLDRARPLIGRQYPTNRASVLDQQLAAAIDDGYKRLLAPTMEREVRAGLTEAGERHAIGVFAANLRPLLLQPPLRGRTVMGIDPGFRTGCKVAVVDETGRYLEGATIYPHAPQGKWGPAIEVTRALVSKHGVSVVAIGNGTACRETEMLIAELIAEGDAGLAYVIVSEAGASVYSASEVARREFPELEAAQRGNISIARRLQDPLAELVKIDPKSIGVGLYQHDVDQKELAAAVERVVEFCVNFAGVDLNTASAALLQHVSGVNRRIADGIMKYRNEHGRFHSREELKKVSGIGEAVFTQCAGFLKIREGVNPLDQTFIHPESYAACARLVARIPGGGGGGEGRLAERMTRWRREERLEGSRLAELARELDVGVPTLVDIMDNLEKPGLDPRDALPQPILRQDVLKLGDLKAGMVLQGTVRNVVDFGAFVDIGVKQDGLVHLSQLADRFVRSAAEVVAVGDVVAVRVLNVDAERGRIQLTMKTT